MYKILGADGKEYGPVNMETLQAWLAQGRVNAQTQVRLEGSSQWQALGTLPGAEELLARKPIPGMPEAAAPTAGAPGPAPAVSSGLAITSLVLGILSMIGLFCVTGIPAIITGHIAHNRTRKFPAQYGGRGPALAGLVLGYCSILLSLLVAVPAGLLLPALAKAKDRATSINCKSNMKQIGLAARIYSSDNNERFPKDFLSMSNELVSPKILTCPADTKRTRMTEWSQFDPANVSYEFLRPGAKEEEVINAPVFRCPIHQHVGQGDGSVTEGDRGTRASRRSR